MVLPKSCLNAEVTIVGTRSILWHRFGPEVLSCERKEKSGIAGNNPEEWKTTVLITENNQLYIEPSYIFACLREGSRYTKRGRSSLQPIIAATLQVLDKIILINRFLPENITTDPNNPVYLDIRSVKNPITKARNLRYRVCASPGWMTKFNIAWDKTLLSKPEMESIIIDSGMFSGLGDARNIGFGRYEMRDFKLYDNA
jgi:hypothetical protein